MFSETELRILAARASSVDERIAGGYRPAQEPDTSDRIARAVQTWCRVIGGDETLLRQRLYSDGLDLDSVRPLLGEVTLDSAMPLPDWSNTFSWAAAAMAVEPQKAALDHIKDPELPIPFEELFLPLASAARCRCRRPADSVISGDAERVLQRALIKRLSNLCAPGLFDGFALARMFRGSGMGSIFLPAPDAQPARGQYMSYITSLQKGELKEFFLERPVLARLVATVVDLWINATDQFAHRLTDDLSSIAEAFNSNRPTGNLVDLQWGFSDAHNGGETVCRLTFDCGLTIGYKPKDLRIDVAWSQLMRWLADNDGPPSGGAAFVLARPGYGWVEWLAASPCEDRRAAQDYFRNAGALLCLLNMLRGTDFHWENVLAMSDKPVPVDLETLLHPRPAQIANRVDQGTAKANAGEYLSGSVLSANYLPQWMKLPGELIVGIGGLDPNHENVSVASFRNINTDVMSYERRPAEPKSSLNIATLNGEPLRVADYEEELIDGFTAMYRFLMSHRDVLLGSNSPLCKFEGLKIRVVIRATALYGALITRSTARECLSDGVSWSLNFDFLSRLSPIEDRDSMFSQVRKSERYALMRLDIPFFTADTDGLHLDLQDGERLDACFTQSSISAVRDHVSHMSEATLDREQTLIRLALQAGLAGLQPKTAAPWVSVGSHAHSDAVSDEASRILSLLERYAIRGTDGVTWIGTLPLAEDRVEVSDIGYSLYSGSAGVALFLAAYARATGSKPIRAFARDALRPLRDRLASHESRRQFARTAGIGGASGLGGIVYAMTTIARLLDDDDILSDAQRVACLISKEAISADKRLDVLDGSAGTLLSLLALHRLRPNDDLLETAVHCGRHLLQRQTDGDPAGRAWITSADHALTGFSHGAAGIAYALLRLDTVDSSEDWQQAALAAIGFETALYAPREQNWPDLRTFGDDCGPQFTCQWCHGATGIGLARLGGLDGHDTAAIRQDIEAAIERTMRMQRGPVDSMCCGNFGRLEFLFTAAHRLRRNELIEPALSRASELVDAARETGSYGWTFGDDRFNPGFFSGLSGAGYSLLRLDQPELLPSILLWD